MTVTRLKDLSKADKGSYYTILGAGGDLQEWVDGLTKMLADEGIGKPTKWFQTTGFDINQYAAKPDGFLHVDDAFPPDLVVLMFPLDGLDVGKLAIFKLRMQDRWFDDVVANMRRGVESL